MQNRAGGGQKTANMDSGDEEVKKEPVDMEADDSESRWRDELRLVLIGRTGCGKSASGNTILGRRQFLSQISASSVTQICELGSAELADDEVSVEDHRVVVQRRTRRVTVVDMPGFGDTRLSVEQIHAEIAKCVSLSAPGPHAFLLVVPIGRYTDSENQAVCELTKIFGEDAVHHHTVVVFTRGDDLEGRGIDEYLRTTAPAGLMALIDRCGGRYHVLNNRDPRNSEQVKELLKKVDRMVRQTTRGFYSNAMFLEAEAVIRQEQKRMMRERGEAEGGEEGGNNGSVEDRVKFTKGRKCDLECDTAKSRESEDDFRVERWTEESQQGSFSLVGDRLERCRAQFRGGRKGGSRAVSRRQSLRSSLSRIRREAALSAKVLERVKILVAAGATGMAVGAVFGAAAPLAAAAGASLVGNSVGFAAGQLAGMSVAGGTGVGKAVGAIVAAASAKTTVALGAAAGGFLGGSVGTIAGAEAASPGEGALDALRQVSIVGATAVGVAAGVGGTMGAGAALGAALEGAAFSTAETAAATVAAGNGTAAVAAGPAGAACGLTGPGGAASQHWGSVAATARILSAVAEIGKAAAGIALAGGLVVKVVKEKVRCGTGATESSYSEKKSYEIHWNK